MNALKKCTKEVNLLLNEFYFTRGEINSIKNKIPDDQRIYVLMLFPYIPFAVRCKAVHLYKKYINPSCKLPFYLVNKLVLSSTDLTLDDYINTLKDIYSTDLIIY